MQCSLEINDEHRLWGEDLPRVRVCLRGAERLEQPVERVESPRVADESRLSTAMNDLQEQLKEAIKDALARGLSRYQVAEVFNDVMEPPDAV